MSLTVNDVTACLDSCSNSSSAPESSCASPPSTLVTLPLRLLSIRESIEKRSLPCMVLSTAQCLNNARRVVLRLVASSAHSRSYETFCLILLGVD